MTCIKKNKTLDANKLGSVIHKEWKLWKGANDQTDDASFLIVEV